MQFRFQSCRVSQYILLCFLASAACGPSNFLPASVGTDQAGRGLDDPPDDQVDPLIDPLRPGEITDIILWGLDHRADVFEPGVPLDDADGVVALFADYQVQDLGNGRSRLFTRTFESTFPLPLCAGERFGQQPVGSFCTGFLVAPNTIATAAHCVRATDVPRTKAVFGFRMQDAVTPQTFEIGNDQIYSGVSLIWRQYISNPSDPRNGEDWALFRLDRPVPDHRVLPIRRAGRIPDAQEVYSIGHPMGLPAKLTDGARVYHNNNNAFFTTNLDAFKGSSGSPVFNATTHEVEGVVVRKGSLGSSDDYFNQSGCYRAKVCTEDSCPGIEATRTTAFSYLLRSFDRPMVTVGARHTCALSNSGRVKCWGSNACGQLGNDTLHEEHLPTNVRNDEVSNIDQIGAGAFHTCARRHDGWIFCWGAQTGQQYSSWDRNPQNPCTGSFTSSPTPVLSGAAELMVTPGGACARLTDGTAKCWHSGQPFTQWTAEPALSNKRWIESQGQICTQTGVDPIRCGSQSLAPALTESLQVSPYTDNGWCGLDANGSIQCGGATPSPYLPTPPDQSLLDQLGNSVDLQFNPPVELCYLTLCDVGEFCELCQFLSGDGIQALVLSGDGSVRSGEIESFNRRDRYQLPPVVTALAGTKQLSASFGIPVFGTLDPVMQIPVFLHHACAVISDGVGRCWGNNSNGQLGNNTTVSTMSPVTVTW